MRPFEPVQVLSSNAFQLWRIFGDGRLGPLDLLVDETPTVPLGQQLDPGLFYARILPEPSATVTVHPIKNKRVSSPFGGEVAA
jgi:hypothetical protein